MSPPISRTLRDLSAGAAFAGVAISEQLPLVILALFGLTLIVALADLRPFRRYPFLGAALLVLSAAGVGMLVFQARLDPVVGACSFAALLAANRMLAEPGPTNDRQVHLSSLLMISGGAALSGELVFGLALAAFTVLAILSLTLSTVELAAEDGPRPPTRRLLWVAARGAAAILILGIGLFILFPRLSWNVSVPRGSAPVSDPSTGFSGEVGLTGDGQLKRDLRVVLRIQLDPDPGRDALDAYWVGKRFWDFDGRNWRGDDRVVARGRDLTLAPGGKGTIYNQVEATPAYGARTLVALDRPILFGGAVVQHRHRRAHTSLVRTEGGEVRFEQPGLSYQYMAYSLPPAAAELTDQERRRALALPARLDPRIATLAEGIAPDQTDPAQVARAIESYLRRGYQYSLELNGQTADPLADFLFVRHAGHCEHFATALAVLLRSRGIPARLASGFYGGERVEDRYVLRGGDAHAWTEAWVGDRWLRLDATPPESRSAQANPWLERIATAWEHLQVLWQSRVVDYSARDQLHAMRKVAQATPSAPALKSLPNVGWLVGAGALLGILWIFFRAAGARFGSRRPVEATRLLDSAERRLRRKGRSLTSVPDPQAWCRELSEAGDPAAPPLDRLVRRYLEARFGQKPLRPGEGRALLRNLERGLASPPPARPTGSAEEPEAHRTAAGR